jgi:hypothetical protein
VQKLGWLFFNALSVGIKQILFGWAFLVALRLRQFVLQQN